MIVMFRPSNTPLIHTQLNWTAKAGSSLPRAYIKPYLFHSYISSHIYNGYIYWALHKYLLTWKYFWILDFQFFSPKSEDSLSGDQEIGFRISIIIHESDEFLFVCYVASTLNVF